MSDLSQKKSIHFKHMSTFNNLKISANKENTQYKIGYNGDVRPGNPQIYWGTICYIEDVKKMWLAGVLYDCNDTDKVFIDSDQEIKVLNNTLDNEIKNIIELNN